MKMIEQIIKKAKKINKNEFVRILFLETNDVRVLKAVDIIKKENIAKVVVLEKKDVMKIPNMLKKAEILLHKNLVDAVITGASHPSALTLYLAFKFMAPGTERISGAFLMVSPDSKKAMIFADCAAQPAPNSKQLMEIAELSARTFRLIAKKNPKVAFLSYSTKGSGKGISADNVREAVKIFNKKYPNVSADGEIQADAALNAIVAKMKKAKPLNYNVIIFPCLDAANISYKLVERLAGWHAVGSILQGLKKPVNDLSRGCSTKDIVALAAITVLQVDEIRKQDKNENK